MYYLMASIHSFYMFYLFSAFSTFEHVALYFDKSYIIIDPYRILSIFYVAVFGSGIDFFNDPDL